MWGAPCELQYLCSNSENLQVSASTEAPALEEYKYSASVQSLLLLLRLVMTSKRRINSQCEELTLKV